MRGLSIIIALVIGLGVGYYGRTYRSTEAPVPGAETASAPASEAAAPAADSGLGEPISWKLASTYTSTLALVGPSGQAFIDDVDALSGGNMKLKFFEPGALVPAFEVFDAVSTGSVDAGYATPGFWSGKVPALQLFAAVPFGPASAEYMAWYYYGGGEALFDEIYVQHNIKSHLCGLFAPEASGWFRTEITSVEELSGLKMRFFGLGARVMEKLGVSTQLLAPGDIFPALELGTIDATELASPAIDQSLGFHQIAKHYYFPGWHQQSTWVEMMVNLDKWNALSAQQQRIIEVACGRMVTRTIALSEAKQVPSMEFFQSQGVTLHEWSPEILAALKVAWGEVLTEEVAADETFARVWQSLSEFRTRYATWRELGYLK